MNRPILTEIPLDLQEILKPGKVSCTMSIGQWDTVLEVMYDQGATLIELDNDEVPITAYRKITKYQVPAIGT